MKIRSFLFAAAALAMPAGAWTQSIEFIETRTSQKYPTSTFTTLKAGGNYYVIEKSFRMAAPTLYDMQVITFGSNLNLVGNEFPDKELTPPDGANIQCGFTGLSDKLAQFKCEFKKAGDSKNYYLYGYPYNASGKRQAQQALNNMASEGAMNSGNFFTAASPDGSKIAVLGEYSRMKDMKEKARVIVYDKDFREVWKKEIEFPYLSESNPDNQVFVNNDGVVFILKRVDVKKAADYESVFIISGNGATVKESKPALGAEVVFSSVVHAFTSNGDLLLSGYYFFDKSAGINVSDPKGSFLVKVSAADGSIPVSKTNTEGALQNLSAKYLLTAEGGEAVLVGEQMYEKSTPKGTTTGEYDYDYNFLNIHAVRFSADGAVKWKYLVNRDLSYRNDGGRLGNTFACMSGNNLVIVYGDHFHKHDGENHPVVGPPLVNWRCNVAEIIGPEGVKTGGGMIKDTRMGGKTGEYHLIPSSGYKVNDKEIFFLAARTLELTPVKVKLP